MFCCWELFKNKLKKKKGEEEAANSEKLAAAEEISCLQQRRFHQVCTVFSHESSKEVAFSPRWTSPVYGAVPASMLSIEPLLIAHASMDLSSLESDRWRICQFVCSAFVGFSLQAKNKSNQFG